MRGHFYPPPQPFIGARQPLEGRKLPTSLIGIAVSLTAFWELSEASGTRNDSHGVNHLTDNNTVTSAVGKVGNAAEFTAANSEYLSRASNANLQPGPNFTVSMWLYLPAAVSVGHAIAKDDVGVNRQWSLAMAATSVPVIYVFDTDGSNVAATSGAGTLAVTTWHHIVFYYTAADKIVRIKINDGAAVASAALTNGIKTDGTKAFEIINSNSDFISVRVDQVGYWQRVLSAAEMTWLYNGGAGRSYSNMVSDVADAPPRSRMPTVLAGINSQHVHALLDTQQTIQGGRPFQRTKPAVPIGGEWIAPRGGGGESITIIDGLIDITEIT